jgi:hypothetical protein
MCVCVCSGILAVGMSTVLPMILVRNQIRNILNERVRAAKVLLLSL